MRRMTHRALVTDMLAKEGKIAGIADINDESSDRIGMRIVVTIKRDAVAKVVINNLYKFTQIESSFAVNSLAIDHGRPKTLNLKESMEVARALFQNW